MTLLLFTESGCEVCLPSMMNTNAKSAARAFFQTKLKLHCSEVDSTRLVTVIADRPFGLYLLYRKEKQSRYDWDDWVIGTIFDENLSLPNWDWWTPNDYPLRAVSSFLFRHNGTKTKKDQ